MRYLIVLSLVMLGCGQETVALKSPSCSIKAEQDGATITCPDGSSAKINNGSSTALAQYNIVGIVNPCGVSPTGHDEVFLKLATGQLLSSYSDSATGNNTRFTLLTPGNYITTDGDNCSFTLTSDNNLANEDHHY